MVVVDVVVVLVVVVVDVVVELVVVGAAEVDGGENRLIVVVGAAVVLVVVLDVDEDDEDVDGVADVLGVSLVGATLVAAGRGLVVGAGRIGASGPEESGTVGTGNSCDAWPWLWSGSLAR